jgi:hypothetical protein
MTPFTDFLNVSMPRDFEVDMLADLQPVLDGGSFDTRIDDRGSRYFQCKGGTVKVWRRGSVVVVGASGRALGHLRAAGLYGDYLSVFAPQPHRVTRLDCTVDLPVPAPPAVAEIAARARGGGLALSRKSISPCDVTTHLSLDRRGEMTGSVYLGAHTAKVRGLVYDKRHQLESTADFDIGPCLRFEIRVSGDLGPSLGDAFDPVRLFWHFAAPDLLPAPRGVHPWVSQAEGYTLPPKVELTASELMRRKLESSADVQRLLDLARQCGRHGVDLLCQRLRSLAAVDAATRAAPGAPGAPEAVSAVRPGVH